MHCSGSIWTGYPSWLDQSINCHFYSCYFAKKARITGLFLFGPVSSWEKWDSPANINSPWSRNMFSYLQVDHRRESFVLCCLVFQQSSILSMLTWILRLWILTLIFLHPRSLIQARQFLLFSVEVVGLPIIFPLVWDQIKTGTALPTSASEADKSLGASSLKITVNSGFWELSVTTCL